MLSVSNRKLLLCRSATQRKRLAECNNRLVDEITYKQAALSAGSATSSAILGPFWRHTVTRENGDTIVRNVPKDGQIALMSGTVTDTVTGKPIKQACVDVWQASTNGMCPPRGCDMSQEP